MPRMTAADAAVAILRREGVTNVFGLPGAAINPFYAAMRRDGTITHTLARHVEGASHMAEGYTRARAGNIGVCVGTSGPAGTDMLTGLYSAAADSIPILCITGQAPVAKLHKEDFQAVNISAIAAPLTKMAMTVLEPAQVPGAFGQAFHLMRSGRPGPVLIDLPFDVQLAEIDFDIDTYQPLPVYRPAATRAQIAKALDMLAAAERPLIVAGGGIINADAADLLVEFAELVEVPVVPTLMGWGTLPDDHRLMAGMAGLQTSHRYGNATLLASDFVLGIGNRWANRHTGGLATYTKGRTFVHVDIEPTQIGRVFAPDYGIVSDAGAALRLFVEVARERKAAGGLVERTEWVRECRHRRATMLRRTHFDNVPIKPQRVYEEMNRAFGPETRYVSTIGLSQIAAAQFLHVYRPRHWINAGQAGPLGWTVPAALGVCVADPDGCVVALSGDYDFQFMIEELAVGAQFHLPYIHVLVNNAYLGLIRQSQRGFDMDYCVQLAFDNVNAPEVGGYGVDHVKVAEGLGCKALRVTEPDEIGPALEAAKKLMAEYRVPVVVEVILERVTNISMGTELDNVTEFEDLATRDEDAPTAVVALLDLQGWTYSGPDPMKIVIAPDKFKGSLAAAQVAAALAAGLRAELPAAELVAIPVADGGDGTVDAAVAAGFERVPVTVDGPTGAPVAGSYARRGEVAVVELACLCGLMRLPGGHPEPLTASSYGAGQALAAALEAGPRRQPQKPAERRQAQKPAERRQAQKPAERRIIFGVGGSASTDGGAGLLQALGARVLDAGGEPLARGLGGGRLRDVAGLDLAGLHPALRACPVILATDVANPLTGPDGAAEVYGPQKGASAAQVAELASGLRHWAAVVADATGTDWALAPGAGAAGGVGFAALAVLGAERRLGIEVMLDLAGFDAALAGAALVITGEGSLDTQTLAGKAPVGVAQAAGRRGIPVAVVAGRSTLTGAQLAGAGITAVYPLSDLEPDPARSTAEASALLERVGRTIAREVLLAARP